MHLVFWGIPLAFMALSAPLAWPAAPAAYQLTTVAGSDQVGDGSRAVVAEVAQPEGLALDSQGNLYIADAANHRVRMVTPAGVITTLAGNGHPGYGGDGGPAAAAQLNQPYDVALDSAGNLYIADYGNQRVRCIGTNGNITTFAGSGSSSGPLGDGGPAGAALLMGPRNLAVDPAGNVYVSEFEGHRVRVVAPGGVISTLTGTGIAGFSGDGSAAAGAQIAFPAGLAVDGSSNLYIVDTGNVRIRKILGATGVISTVITQYSFGMPNIQLSGLAASSVGNLYIPESGNAFVWMLTPAGSLTRVAGAPGSGAYTGDGQLATTTALGLPVEVTLDPAGDLYISELRRVRVVTAATGIINTVAGDGIFGFSGDNGPATMAALNAPVGVALKNGVLYFADQSNQRVRQVSGGIISTVAGDGTATYSGDGLPATTAGLDSPSGLTVDPSGNLYIADTYNQRVRRVIPSGMITTFAGNGTITGFGANDDAATLIPLDAPQGVTADSSGNIYIADTNHDRVLEVDTQSNAQTIAGTGTPGFAGDGGAGLPELNGPTGLAVDGQGNLFIADTQNQRIRMLSAAGVTSTIAGNGTAGYSGDGGPATSAALNFPAGVAVAPNGYIYIADTGNNCVRLITPDGNINTIAGTGAAGYNGDSGIATIIALYNPTGLAMDSQGDIYVSDTGNNRVRMLSLSQSVTTTTPVTVALANSASLLPGPLAPGEIFSIFGPGIGPQTAAYGSFDSNGMLSTTLGGVQVTLNGTPCPLFYVQAQQINAQVPYEVAGLDSAQLQIFFQGITLAAQQVALVAASPALFTLNYGTGNAVIVNEDGTINSDQNPAPQGSYVVLYATGQGQTNPAGVTGQGAQAPYPPPVLQPVALTMAGVPADVLFAGDAPGFVGLMQINAVVPAGFVPTGDLPLVLSAGNYTSPPGVTIAVK